MITSHRTTKILARATIRAEQLNVQAPEPQTDKTAEIMRVIPLVAGASGIAGVLLNRVFSGIAPVVSASSSQSRTDVLLIFMSAILALTGLQWLSLKPKTPIAVALDGVQATYLDSNCPESSKTEFKWAWDALTRATSAKILVVLYQGKCILHFGAAKSSDIVGNASPGPMCEEAMQKATGKYLANLQLFPGRFELLDYLPANTQSAIIQPIGSQGVMIVGSPYQRGFSRLDQAWIATLCDKLEVVLDDTPSK